MKFEPSASLMQMKPSANESMLHSSC